MKKYCKHCGEFEVDPDENFCPRCGAPFEKRASMSEWANDSVSSSVQPATVQQDNRIHKGDKVTIGGDNFNAQNVDNRTVTNTSNTTINNINNIVDESRKVVQCELSGKTVQIIDTVVCRKCKRRISKEYYIESMWLCQDCYQKELEANRADSKEQKVGIPPIMPNVNVGQQMRPENMRVEPIGEYTVKRNTAKYFIYGGLLVIVVFVLGMFFWKNMENKPQQGSVAQQAEVVKETAEKVPSSSSVSLSSVSSVSSSSSVTQSARETSGKSSDNVREESKGTEVPSQPVQSQYELGKNAYNAGEYTKASLHLEKALQDGKTGAAYYLAMMYKQGKGVSKNIRKAFTYMKQAAEGGVSNAYYELAEMYRLGRGTEANRSLAKKWYEEAVTSSALNADKAEKALSKYN